MFQPNVKLSLYSNYKIGGAASHFFEAKNRDEIINAVTNWRSKNPRKKIFILGGGTNLLINDNGFNGLVLKPGLTSLSHEGELIRAGSGVHMPDLLEFAAGKGLSGLEWAGGLPGTLGGAIRGNAGAFGGEIKDCVFEVTSLDTSGKSPRLLRRLKNECAFGYRDSIFKQKNNQEIILEAALVLKKGDSKYIQDAIAEKIKYRRERHPMEYPNIGSIFKNVDLKLVSKKRAAELQHVIKTDPFPVIPTAYLIAESGLKGISCGGAMVSPKHPNFIVNILNASSEDVKSLIKLVKSKVKSKFGIKLEEEIIHL